MIEDNKKTKIVKDVCEDCVILQPDRPYVIVLMKNIEHIVSDRRKSRIVPEGPTQARLKTLQTFLKKLEKREIQKKCTKDFV